jgi:hypothetical protein
VCIAAENPCVTGITSANNPPFRLRDKIHHEGHEAHEAEGTHRVENHRDFLMPFMIFMVCFGAYAVGNC